MPGRHDTHTVQDSPIPAGVRTALSSMSRCDVIAPDSGGGKSQSGTNQNGKTGHTRHDCYLKVLTLSCIRSLTTLRFDSFSIVLIDRSVFRYPNIHHMQSMLSVSPLTHTACVMSEIHEHDHIHDPTSRPLGTHLAPTCTVHTIHPHPHHMERPPPTHRAPSIA